MIPESKVTDEMWREYLKTYGFANRHYYGVSWHQNVSWEEIAGACVLVIFVFMLLGVFEAAWELDEWPQSLSESERYHPLPDVPLSGTVTNSYGIYIQDQSN